MTPAPTITLAPKEGRFARLEAIRWWKQPVLSEARVLVVGAGALGNEVIKNLALLGCGHIAVADMDRIEESNLTRSVLFRESDEGRLKSEVAVEAARQIYPAIHAHALSGNVLADLGLGWFRWANVVIGALDNREARLFVNSACARVNRPWIDGGIDILHGIVRGFAPPETACYECTMGEADWTLVNQRRSCSMLARRAAQDRGTPTTPTTASIIGAMQVQEVVKLLHGREPLLGKGIVFDGDGHNSFLATYPRHPDCPWHEAPAAIESVAPFNSKTPLRQILQEGKDRLGHVVALDVSREIVAELRCVACNRSESIYQPAEKVDSERIACATCGSERTPEFLHSVSAQSPLLDRTAEEIGLPLWDVIWARNAGNSIGFELSGDSTAMIN